MQSDTTFCANMPHMEQHQIHNKFVFIFSRTLTDVNTTSHNQILSINVFLASEQLCLKMKYVYIETYHAHISHKYHSLFLLS